MTQGGHRLVGAALGAALVAVLLPRVGWAAWLVLPGSFIGSTLPDRLEWTAYGRWCEHRTLTHWWTWWLALGVVSAMHLPAGWAVALLGVAAGAFSHLLVDWPNPTGIPLLHPWARHSLRWWRSGEREIPIVLLAFAMSLSIWLPDLLHR